MEGLLRHTVIASGIKFSWHQHDTTAMEDIAEKRIKFMHRHYVFFDFELIVRFDLVIAFMAIYFCGTTNSISYAIIYTRITIANQKI